MTKMPVPSNPPVPYNLKPKDTKLPTGHDDSLDPAEPPTDAETRGAEPFDWAAVDTAPGPRAPADAPLAPPAVDSAVRSVPASSWPRALPEFIPGRPVHLAIPVPDLDPDIAMWREVTVSIWPFTGAPTEGEWPKGWLGIDNTSAVWVCTVGGEPGTWVQLSGGGGIGGPFMPIANPTGITEGTETPDPISGSDSAKWVEFPSDASVMAWGLAGDAFPRVVFGADPFDSAVVMFGNGTADPTSVGALLGAFTDSNRPKVLPLLHGPNPGIAGAVLGGGNVAFGSWSDLTTMPVGAGSIGDFVPAWDIVGASIPVAGTWRCTVSDPTAATFKLVSVVGPTDPITSSVTPHNAGILWQDTSGSGSLWMSTGTGSGDWALIGGDTGWVDVSGILQNSWALSGGGKAQYRKKNGVIYIELQVTGGSGPGVFTIPAGFRPGTSIGCAAPVATSGVDQAGFATINSSTGLVSVEQVGDTTPDIVNAAFSYVGDA